MNFNKTMVGGNLGKDPEGKDIKNNLFLCKFSIAVNRKTKNGEAKVSWIEVVAWGALGKECMKNLKKGSSVFVEGYLDQSKWSDNDNPKIERSKLTLVAENILFMPTILTDKEGENQPESRLSTPVGVETELNENTDWL